LGDEFRERFAKFIVLRAATRANESLLRHVEVTWLRNLLSQGLLSDLKIRRTPSVPERIDGLCPTNLAKQLLRMRDGKAIPLSIQKRGALAALAAMDRAARYNAPSLPAKELTAMAREYRALLKSKRFVPFTWRVWVPSTRTGAMDGPNPQSLALKELAKFSADDFLTISLY